MIANDIFATVTEMRQEAIDALEVDDALLDGTPARALKEAEVQAFTRVLHVLEDDYGVERPFPSFSVRV